jgi:hypothetical protein
MLRKSPNLLLLSFLLVAALSGALSGCSNASASGTSTFKMAPMSEMPAEVQEAPQVVREAYQFAVANPEVLKQLPCYCGCGDMGHTSNYACYVQNKAEDGAITFDTHALGCSICVDITQDAMRLLDDGKTITEIRAYVDETYAQYGPSNMPADQ